MVVEAAEFQFNLRPPRFEGGALASADFVDIWDDTFRFLYRMSDNSTIVNQHSLLVAGFGCLLFRLRNRSSLPFFGNRPLWKILISIRF